MSNKPLLIFPTATLITERSPLQGGPSKLHRPSKERQGERMSDRFNVLFEALDNKRFFLRQNVDGATPELVLVIEYIGSITNFFRAASNVPELEFLNEFEHLFEPDDDFYLIDDYGSRNEKEIGGQLFLVMTNQTALTQLQTLWHHYQNDTWERHPTTNNIMGGVAKFRELFACLKDIRPYNIQDRLRDTGFANYIDDQRRDGNPIVQFEIELFYSEKNRTLTGIEQIRQLLNISNGNLISNSEVKIPEIQYHAVVAEAPIGVFDDLTDNSNIAFLKCEYIMHLRPVGQNISGTPSVEQNLPDVSLELSSENANMSPIIALLDGYPFSTHVALRNKVVIDDPDDFLSHYQANEMLHGTTMASLIINGELDTSDNIQLDRPIYVRPIMHPDPNDSFNNPRREIIPTSKLPIDLIHRAVRRMFEGEDGQPAIAPDVKVINLSIGDPARPFHLNISAWAKLLDWLSYKYNILFIISAGNNSSDILIPYIESDFRAFPDERKAAIIFEAVRNRNMQMQKVLTPGESINGLTIGSTYTDNYTSVGIGMPLFNSGSYLAPYSRFGLGYKKSVKPDILNCGGRLPYRSNIRHRTAGETSFIIPQNAYQAIGPGHKVAVPGAQGENSKSAYTSGTSNSTALTSRLAAQLHEVLEVIRTESVIAHNIINYYPVLIKALIVHGANWDDVSSVVRSSFSNDPQISTQTIRDRISSCIGYGKTYGSRVLYCTDQRVTILGYGELKQESANQYTFPLPMELSQRAITKRLIITLAWISPLNFNTSKYRQASMYFDNLTFDRQRRPDEALHLSNIGAGVPSSRRGTVQHMVMEGSEMDSFIDGDNLVIKVNCREDAGGLKRTMVKYGLAVTLELREQTEVSIYEEVRQKLQSQVQTPIRPRV